jgi:hypothetical protein
MAALNALLLLLLLLLPPAAATVFHYAERITSAHTHTTTPTRSVLQPELLIAYSMHNNMIKKLRFSPRGIAAAVRYAERITNLARTFGICTMCWQYTQVSATSSCSSVMLLAVPVLCLIMT